MEVNNSKMNLHFPSDEIAMFDEDFVASLPTPDDVKGLIANWERWDTSNRGNRTVSSQMPLLSEDKSYETFDEFTVASTDACTRASLCDMDASHSVMSDLSERTTSGAGTCRTREQGYSYDDDSTTSGKRQRIAFEPPSSHPAGGVSDDTPRVITTDAAYAYYEDEKDRSTIPEFDVVLGNPHTPTAATKIYREVRRDYAKRYPSNEQLQELKTILYRRLAQVMDLPRAPRFWYSTSTRSKLIPQSEVRILKKGKLQETYGMATNEAIKEDIRGAPRQSRSRAKNLFKIQKDSTLLVATQQARRNARAWAGHHKLKQLCADGFLDDIDRMTAWRGMYMQKKIESEQRGQLAEANIYHIHAKQLEIIFISLISQLGNAMIDREQQSREPDLVSKDGSNDGRGTDDGAGGRGGSGSGGNGSDDAMGGGGDNYGSVMPPPPPPSSSSNDTAPASSGDPTMGDGGSSSPAAGESLTGMGGYESLLFEGSNGSPTRTYRDVFDSDDDASSFGSGIEDDELDLDPYDAGSGTVTTASISRESVETNENVSPTSQVWRQSLFVSRGQASGTIVRNAETDHALLAIAAPSEDGANLHLRNYDPAASGVSRPRDDSIELKPQDTMGHPISAAMPQLVLSFDDDDDDDDDSMNTTDRQDEKDEVSDFRVTFRAKHELVQLAAARRIQSIARGHLLRLRLRRCVDHGRNTLSSQQVRDKTIRKRWAGYSNIVSILAEAEKQTELLMESMDASLASRSNVNSARLPSLCDFDVGHHRSIWRSPGTVPERPPSHHDGLDSKPLEQKSLSVSMGSAFAMLRASWQTGLVPTPTAAAGGPR